MTAISRVVSLFRRTVRHCAPAAPHLFADIPDLWAAEPGPEWRYVQAWTLRVGDEVNVEWCGEIRRIKEFRKVGDYREAVYVPMAVPPRSRDVCRLFPADWVFARRRGAVDG